MRCEVAAKRIHLIELSSSSHLLYAVWVVEFIKPDVKDFRNVQSKILNFARENEELESVDLLTDKEMSLHVHHVRNFNQLFKKSARWLVSLKRNVINLNRLIRFGVQASDAAT